MKSFTDRKNNSIRTDLLTILCILTFIGSGLAVFSNFFLYLSFDDVILIMEDYEFQIPGIEMIISGGRQFFLTGFILYFISLIGAVRMWRLKKIGFHLYTVAQIFIFILPLVLIESYPFSFIGLLITVLFILAYATNLKYMT